MKRLKQYHSTNFFPQHLVLPFAAAGVLALVSLTLHFNGLYGQDAHEYLRLSRAYYDQLRGISYQPLGRGDVVFAVGYPLSGALLRFAGLPAPAALQVVSWLSAAAALYGFDACIRVLSPGAHRWSRRLYAVVALGLSGQFVRAGVSVMSDALGLALLLGAFHYGLRAVEGRRGRDAVWAAFFCGGSLLTRFAVAPLLVPLALGVAVALLRVPARPGRRDWNAGWLGLAFLTGLLTLAPHFLLKSQSAVSPFSHSLLIDWSPFNLFRATLTEASGTVSYRFPNAVFILYPLAHPGFLLPLPLLFLMARRTDFLLPAKRVLLVCLAAYGLFLGGLPSQNIRYLLPAYTLVLLLMFPAWDRFVSYGFYFFKKLTSGLVLGAVLLQVFFTVKMMWPVWQRNRLEKLAAEKIQAATTPGAAVYAFDLDIALRTYLPDRRVMGLWERHYESFEEGALFLFNEPRLRQQWQDRNPMLNWETAVQEHSLAPLDSLPDGWTLYRIVK
ncbi:MAG: hypothetical protein U0U46_07085 [Saprospiraceae bacterium]